MRYFLVSYSAQSNSYTARGNVYHAGTLHPSNQEVKEQAVTAGKGRFDINDVAVTGIHEFKNVEDYNMFKTGKL